MKTHANPDVHGNCQRPQASSSATGYAPTERLAARMAGAAAAMRGEKLGANGNPEESELHFEWLAGWTAARMEKLKAHNDDRISDPAKRRVD